MTKRFAIPVVITMEARDENEAWAQVHAMGSQAMMAYSNILSHRIAGELLNTDDDAQFWDFYLQEADK